MLKNLPPRAVLPVIHAETEAQTLENIDVARRAGAEGVFIINHEMQAVYLLSLYHAVRRNYPDYWIGVNCLDLHPKDVFRVFPHELAAVWADDAKLAETRRGLDAYAIQTVRDVSNSKALYFGGVAFKYQPKPQDLYAEARKASPFVDVITTSGDATGTPPTVEKIRTIRESVGARPIAIASGISIENIDQFLPLANYFLVATSISQDFTTLDLDRTCELVERVANYEVAR